MLLLLLALKVWLEPQLLLILIFTMLVPIKVKSRQGSPNHQVNEYVLRCRRSKSMLSLIQMTVWFCFWTVHLSLDLVQFLERTQLGQFVEP